MPIIEGKKNRFRDEYGELLTDQWETKDTLIKECYELLGTLLEKHPVITIDAFASKHNKKAPVYFSREENALLLDWVEEARKRSNCFERDLFFANPPYSQQMIGKCVAKMHREAVKGCWIIGLLPVSTSSKWWHRYIKPLPLTHQHFLEGRRSFIPPPGLKTKDRPSGDNVVVLMTPEVCLPYPSDLV
jgi:phage N-6-adenine-methyltransferase